MTRTQYQYWTTIRDFVAKHGYFPNYREIARAVGVVSLSAVHKAIKILVGYGYIVKRGKYYELVPTKMHGLQNCDHGHDAIWFMSANCPLCSVLSRIPRAGVV